MEVMMSLTSDELLYGNYCVHEVSKDLDGLVALLYGDYPPCPALNCSPLMELQFLRLDARSNASCDSEPPGLALDGPIRVKDFTTVYTGPKESLRGVHAGRFNWAPTVGGGITGTLQGISNAGVLRPPIFKEKCETCHAPGIVSGHLFGTGKGVPGVPVHEFQLEAIYRLAWDPLAWDPSISFFPNAPVRGTLEGVLVLTCP
jgi:hypothetical protein